MVYAGIWLICGIIAAVIYSNKGRSGLTAFIVGFLFGPIGVILAALTPADTAAVERKAVTTGSMKKCPFCAELVRAEATVCKHCQRELPAVVAEPGVARIVPNGSGGYTCSACGGGVRADATTCKHCKKPLIVGAATYAAGKPPAPPAPPAPPMA